MIADLKSYPKMKASGVPWLGDMPMHWTVKRGKALFHCVDIRSSTGEEELLTVSSERGVVPRSSATVTMFKAESYVGYKLCWPRDLVINSLWAWARGLGVSRHHGIISSAYGVYRLRPSYSEYSAYFHELVRSMPFNWELRVRSKGIWISRLQLTDEAFLGAPFPLPPSQEQAAIVRYLDHVDRRIQRYIRAKQKLIALLEEQKQAVIHQAVTGQVDVRTGQPYPAYKPSGVEWLGDVPEHWEIVPNRALMKIKKELVGSKSGDYLLLSLTKRGVVARDIENPEGKFPAQFDSYQIIEPGDLIFCLFDIDETPRAVGLSLLHGMITGAYTRFVCTDEPCRRFVYLLYMALDNGKYLKPLYTGLRKVITKSTFLSARMPLPSPLERATIVRYIDKTTDDIDTAIDGARRQVELLQEYRTRLIADVVTGKFDVREAAARLPDEIEEREPSGEDEAWCEPVDDGISQAEALH